MIRGAGTPRVAARSGFSLMEVVVALALMALGFACLAPLLAQCTRVLGAAAAESRAVAAAVSRLEELNALVHEQRSSTLTPVTDESTDLSTVPATLNGTGLTSGAPSTAWHDVPGHVDTVRDDGSTTTARKEATTLRRWAVSAVVGAGTGDTRLLQVFAAAAALEDAGAARGSSAPKPGDVWLFDVRPRTLR